MRAAKFLVGLGVVFLLHLLAERFFPWVSSVDFFIVLIVFNALDGHLPAAMLGGLAAGFASW